MADFVEVVVTQEEIVFSWLLSNYFRMLGINVEVEQVWKQRRASRYWFFLNRYYAFFGNVAALIVWFVPLSEAGLNVALVLLFVRTYALWGRSKKMLALMLTVAVILVSIVIWTQTQSDKSPVHNIAHCLTYMSNDVAIHSRMISWVAAIVWDTLIFTLTVARTYQAARLARQFVNSSVLPLTTIMLRDGSMYFVVMILANLSNIMTYLPYLKGSLSTFANGVSATLMSRLMLNLHSRVPRAMSGSHSDVFDVVPPSSSFYPQFSGQRNGDVVELIPVTMPVRPTPLYRLRDNPLPRSP
ncbi:hypothetical protein FISHEDRAFT_56189 [Fistulina hepatica ATCC 64428]|uniref:Uncharacterized protein n=1 Tax=Fistulina hepatica ATCC 64428 TaxID=1128425 RepID=A0A0D7AK63_9AGAR|nr:hypothetical protein FISHEDRAFT_56189 [Fistulina hepatica ATCC 64428]